MPIRSDFTPEGLNAVTPGELRGFKEMMFGRGGGAADAVAEAYISSYDEFADFQESLDRNLTKFTFAKHSIDEWKRRYVFPHPRLINVQLRALGVAEGDLEAARRQIVNLDAETIRRWTRRNLIDAPRENAPRGAGAVVYVQGTVGSGKSSLNKYITTVLFEDFVEAKVIPSRIECRKLLDHISLHLGEPATWTRRNVAEQLERFMKQSLVRDIIHYSRSRFASEGTKSILAASAHNERFPGLKGSDFDKFVRDALIDCQRPQEQAPAITDAIDRTFEVIGKMKPTGRTRVSRAMLGKLEDFTLDTIIGWYQQAGVRFALLLDGFDYIEAVDFFSERSAQAQLIEAVADWIQRDECRIPINCGNWTVEPNVSLTIRRNTRSILGRKHNQIFSAARARSAYVLSPSMQDLYYAMAKDLGETAVFGDRRHKPDNIVRIIDRVRRTINHELDLSGGLSIGSLFNGNVRHQINYTRDVIYELAASSLKLGTPTSNSHGLISQIDFEVANFIKQKSYRLVDMLLYSAGHRFANFVHVRAPEPGRPPRPLTQDDLEDNNIGSGYVGNVLNYHSAYTSPNDIAFLLEKVRILELIRQRGIERRGRATEGEADESWLRTRFARNNWPVSPDFRMSLYLLVREGMLEVVESERVDRFSILPLGVVAVEKLVTKLVYLENIFFGTLLPDFVYRAADDIERAQSVTRWTASSLVHTWLLLRTVEYAESVGVSGEKAQAKFAFTRMLSGVRKSVELISAAEQDSTLDPADRPTVIAHRKIDAYRREVLHLKPGRPSRPRDMPGSNPQSPEA